jgi:hypothetical protein
MSVLVHVCSALSVYFSEIIIKLNVNLITSNRLSVIGVGEVQWVQMVEYGVAN